MAIKKRSKIQPAFNMSSLTDIIFLLLIFFMLTSSLVTPNALNLKLPGKSQTQVVSQSDIPEVAISPSGKYRYDGQAANLALIEKRLERISRKKKPILTIAPDSNSPVESVVAIMDIALKYHIETIMAVEE